MTTVIKKMAQWFVTTLSLLALLAAGVIAYMLLMWRDEITSAEADAHAALTEARAAKAIADAGLETFEARIVALENSDDNTDESGDEGDEGDDEDETDP